MRPLSYLAKGAAALMLAVCIDAMAQSPAREFDIPAGELKTAIDTYATQSGVQLIYKVAEVKGLAGKAVKGKMAPEEALSQLLEGTSLHVVRDATNAVVIFRAPTAAPASSAPKASVEPEGEPTTVVVSGLRASLQSARNKKRDNDAISDSIVADDIGKMPDQNIAEAAQRIPGVQMNRYKGEGAGIAIRGLGQTKVVLNGLEVFGASAHDGEYNGRNFDLEDLPAEVLAGVDVAKSSSANEIEGGLGGYVNIRTRQPFDFKSDTLTLSAKATNYQMASGFGSKVKGQGSALLSGRRSTGVGEMGLLLNVAHTESVFGIGEDEVQRTQDIDNYAGSGKTVRLPIGMFTGNGHHGDRARDTYIAAYQWRPNNSLNIYANYIAVNYLERDDFDTARFNVGTPTATFSLWGDKNANGSDNLKTGSFTGNSMNNAAVYGDEGRKSHLADIGGKWSDGGPLTIKARLSHNETKVVNTLYEWGINAAVPTMSLTMNDGSPSHVAVSGVDLTNPANYHPNYLLSIHLDGTQKNTATTLDANYKLEQGILRSVDVGLRANDYTRHSFGFVNFNCIDGCASSKTLATLNPAMLQQIPAAQSQDVGAYPTFASAAIRTQDGTLRALYGVPADANQPAQDQLNNEKTLAAYVKLNYEFDLGGKAITGNIGARPIRTKLHGESYGADASGKLVLQAKDSTRHDVLPSLNTNLALTDETALRFAASKTLGQVNFGYLSAAVNIGNQVQHDAQAGNPDLKPYTSKNYDLSLEHYFGKNGMAVFGLFNKTVDGFVQTVAEKRVINGELYNVSTYQSAGTSKINGAELGYQRFFDGLPAPFDGLGVQANYTYVDSKAPSAVVGQSVPLQGLSKNSYNLVGIYEKGQIKARLAYNYRSGYVVSTSSSGAQGVPIMAKALGTLDFSIGYDVTKQLSVVLDGVNITGASSEQYYGNVHNQMNYLPLNRRYGVQARYSF